MIFVLGQLFLNAYLVAIPVGVGAFLALMYQRWQLAKRLLPLFDRELKGSIAFVHVEPAFFPSHVRAGAYALLVLNRGTLVPRVPRVLGYDFRGKLDGETLEACRRYRRTVNLLLRSLLWVLVFATPMLWRKPAVTPLTAENVAEQLGLLAAFLALVFLPRVFRKRLVPRLDPVLGDLFPYQRPGWDEDDAVAERARMYAGFVAVPPFYAWRIPKVREVRPHRLVSFLDRCLATLYLGLWIAVFSILAAIAFHR